jgi:molybdopterin converting factor small subunit
MEASRIRVLYFADAARRVGRREEQLESRPAEKLGSLQAQIFARHPALAELSEVLLWSVDEQMAGPETPLVDGSVVGVLPPFSGG